MAVNQKNSAAQAPKQTQAQAQPKAAPAPKKLRVYLAMGASFFYEGFRFERDTIYEVEESFGEWLLDLEGHADQKKFEEATRKQAGLPVVAYSRKAGVQSIETEEDLAEIAAHLANGPAAVEEGQEGAADEGEGKGEVEL